MYNRQKSFEEGQTPFFFGFSNKMFCGILDRKKKGGGCVEKVSPHIRRGIAPDVRIKLSENPVYKAITQAIEQEVGPNGSPYDILYSQTLMESFEQLREAYQEAEYFVLRAKELVEPILELDEKFDKVYTPEQFEIAWTPEAEENFRKILEFSRGVFDRAQPDNLKEVTDELGLQLPDSEIERIKEDAKRRADEFDIKSFVKDEVLKRNQPKRDEYEPTLQSVQRRDKNGELYWEDTITRDSIDPDSVLKPEEIDDFLSGAFERLKEERDKTINWTPVEREEKQPDAQGMSLEEILDRVALPKISYGKDSQALDQGATARKEDLFRQLEDANEKTEELDRGVAARKEDLFRQLEDTRILDKDLVEMVITDSSDSAKSSPLLKDVGEAKVSEPLPEEVVPEDLVDVADAVLPKEYGHSTEFGIEEFETINNQVLKAADQVDKVMDVVDGLNIPEEINPKLDLKLRPISVKKVQGHEIILKKQPDYRFDDRVKAKGIPDSPAKVFAKSGTNLRLNEQRLNLLAMRRLPVSHHIDQYVKDNHAYHRAYLMPRIAYEPEWQKQAISSYEEIPVRSLDDIPTILRDINRDLASPALEVVDHFVEARKKDSRDEDLELFDRAQALVAERAQAAIEQARGGRQLSAGMDM